jgi:V/A-type H+-transporting ATPase subunit K
MEFSLATLLVLGGAGIAALLSFIGSTIGMERVGRAAAGATAERPELFGKLLLMQALPGSVGIYGLVGMFLILSFSGILGGEAGGEPLTVATGVAYLLSSLPLAFSTLFAGIFLGNVAASGVGMIAKDDSLLARGMILAALVETWAIFGLLVTFIFLTLI